MNNFLAKQALKQYKNRIKKAYESGYLDNAANISKYIDIVKYKYEENNNLFTHYEGMVIYLNGITEYHNADVCLLPINISLIDEKIKPKLKSKRYVKNRQSYRV